MADLRERVSAGLDLMTDMPAPHSADQEDMRALVACVACAVTPNKDGQELRFEARMATIVRGLQAAYALGCKRGIDLGVKSASDLAKVLTTIAGTEGNKGGESDAEARPC